MGLFDFIAGDDFRSCLESDYEELYRAMNSKAWKTVHVLAGSVIEALLVDYLVSSDYLKRAGKDPMRMDLAQVIGACEADGLLSKKTSDLSNVVRDYRNLIHPGRLIRLGETVTAQGATIAHALVEMIVAEVASKRKQTYGYTSEQIVNKIIKDPAAGSYAEHLLKETNGAELRRLLLKVAPERYMALFDDEDVSAEVLEALSRTFRAARKLADADLRVEVSKRYVSILKEESGTFIKRYENAFVRGSDLKCLDPDDAALAIRHLLNRLENDADDDLLKIIERGFVRRLNEKEMEAFIDSLVSISILGHLRDKATALLERLVKETSAEQDEWITSRLHDWVVHLEKQGNHHAADKIKSIRSSYPPMESEMEDLPELEIEADDVPS